MYVGELAWASMASFVSRPVTPAAEPPDAGAPGTHAPRRSEEA